MSRKHDESKTRPWQCDECEKSYRFQEGLRLHKMSHTGLYLGRSGGRGLPVPGTNEFCTTLKY